MMYEDLNKNCMIDSKKDLFRKKICGAFADFGTYNHEATIHSYNHEATNDKLYKIYI